MIIAVIGLAVEACSSIARHAGTNDQHVNLARCHQIEPGLYRCLASEAPLCDPTFARATEVDCVKITEDGELLEPMPKPQ